MKRNYFVMFVCKNCYTKSTFNVNKRTVAFQLWENDEQNRFKCSNCNSTEYSSLGYSSHSDYEILKEWAENTDLYLSSQDEDLLIRGVELEDIIKVINDKSINTWRISFLKTILINHVLDMLNRNYPQEQIDKYTKAIKDNNINTTDIIELGNGSLKNQLIIKEHFDQISDEESKKLKEFLELENKQQKPSYGLLVKSLRRAYFLKWELQSKLERLKNRFS